MPKLYWKVEPTPTGQYASFQHRAWPLAYSDRKYQYALVQIIGPRRYSKRLAESGEHEPLEVMVALRRTPADDSWSWRRLTARFKTLAEAKVAAEELYDVHHSRFRKVD